MIEQRTYEWAEKRRGLFTASQIHKLMGARGLGLTGETYILEKVTEALGVYLPEIKTAAMEYGTNLEPVAKQYYEMAFGCEILEQPFLIADWCDQAGASPDGKIKGTKKGLEIKCPFNPVNHTKNLMIKSAEDLKKISPEYYWQTQMEMAVSGFESLDFVSFHPEFTGLNRMMAIELHPVEADIILLTQRIEEAVIMKNVILKKIQL